MAGLYTYEEFKKAAEQAGLLGQFSAADLKLAQSNPDAGMKILGYKQDWNAAPTDEARALAHEGTEKIRRISALLRRRERQRVNLCRRRKQQKPSAQLIGRF
jgi:hypothetical protein